jgi:CBS domain-containing membrane protein
MIKEKVKRSYRISKYIIYKETLVDSKEAFWSFLGAFIGIAAIGFIQSFYLEHFENVFLIGSFGATAVLIYGAIQSPLAQPRNLIGGHLISALIGVSIYKIIPEPIWLSAPLAVSISILAMQYTKNTSSTGRGYCFDSGIRHKQNCITWVFICFVSCINRCFNYAYSSPCF